VKDIFEIGSPRRRATVIHQRDREHFCLDEITLYFVKRESTCRASTEQRATRACVRASAGFLCAEHVLACGLDIPALPSSLSLLPKELVRNSFKFLRLRVCRDINVGNAHHVPVSVVVELGPDSLNSRIVKVDLN
jgi:hypothetical protein